MGLAGTKVKQRFGLDPRNTNWSNDESRFGHQYLEKLGWKPGKGLGLVEHATISHVKVSIKDDNLGLGAKLAKKEKKDEFDSGECAGLDAFQRILGRLNGKEDKIGSELDRQRSENIINGKWGMHFVKGDVLRSTWDTEAKKLIQSNKSGTDKDATESRKRGRDSSDGSNTEEESLAKKLRKKEKKETKVKKDKKENKEKKEKGVKKEKKEKKEKREKKEKKEKKERKHKITADESKEDTETFEKKGAKSRKSKREDKGKEEITRESMLKPKESTGSTEPAISSRLAVRSRWIKQKRAAVMDAKSLNEIFMITN